MEDDSYGDGSDERKSTTRSVVGRRPYLKSMMGAVATLGVASTGVAAAADGDYDVIEVPAGERYEKRIGDGETFENTLIDITAEGATYLIYASGSDWTVRNVGVRGVWDEFEKAEPFIALVDEGSTGVIENVYLGDGAIDDSYPGSTGIYVGKSHAGTLKIDRVNIQGFPDNAIYASTPGHTDEYDSGTGGGGEVHITNSFAADCRAAHFRIGTDGSYCRNCVAVGGDRGFIGRFQHTEAYDCDFSGGRFGDVVVGAPGWDTSDTASVRVEDTRYGTTHLYWDENELTGSSAGQPRTDPPAGVPTTPEEAAGSSTDANTGGSVGDTDGSGSDDGTETDDEETTLPHTLTVETNEGGPLVEYELTVEGTVSKGDTAEGNDTITEDGETTIVAGVTGNGYTDDYRFDGELVDWSANVDPEHFRVLVDGEEATADESTEHTLTVETNEGGPLVEYELTVEGTVSKGDTAEGNDTITEDGETTIVAGVTGNGYTDDYRFDGELVDWSANVDPEHFRVLVDGEEATAAPDEPRTFTIETSEGGPLVRYEFTVDGPVSKGPNAEGGKSVASDTVTEDGDTTIVAGATGNGYTDDYEIRGRLTDWTANVSADRFRLLVDGEEIDPAQI